MQFLKQSTAVTIKLGPFIDDGDGKSAETGLTISQADIRLSKNGGDFAQTNNSAGATHDELGYYNVPLDTTDTNTLGRLLVAVHESGALPVWKEFMVVTANVWDTLCSTDALDVNVTSLADDVITSAKFDESTAFPVKSADTGATAIARVGADSDTLKTLSDQIDAVKAETASILEDTGTTIPGTITTIDNEIAVIDGIVDSILEDTGTTLDTKINTIDDFLDTEVAAILADTNELQTDWVNGGRLDSLIDAIKTKTDTITTPPTAASVADAVWDELLAGHIIPGSAGAILADGTTDISTVLALLSTSPSLLQQRCMNNDDLICRKSGDFVASFIYLGDLSGVTNLYFTVKPQTLVNSLPDNQATIQIQEGVGLLYINGGVAGVPANGSITITDAPAGHITINLDAVETAKLTANTKYRYDIKADHNILAEGAFFVQSAITLAV